MRPTAGSRGLRGPLKAASAVAGFRCHSEPRAPAVAGFASDGRDPPGATTLRLPPVRRCLI